ncbi:MAG: hypothetical protein V1837_07940 [Candidatus Woesearchaeota archaeon]
MNPKEFGILRKEIREMDRWNHLDWKKVDIELVTTEGARGMVYLGGIMDVVEFRLRDMYDHPYRDFTDALVDDYKGGSIFRKIGDAIADLRTEGQNPTKFSLEFKEAGNWADFIHWYAYNINFYGGRIN